MTQEEKNLLLKDLCSRLPYGVKVYGVFLNYNKDKDKILYEECDKEFNYSHLNRYGTLKPYLFPLSSISEDQKYDFYCRFIKNDCNFDDFKKFYLYNGMWRRKLLTFTSLYDIEAIIDWFHKNHIDYRDLIPMGLAIDATGLNIY